MIDLQNFIPMQIRQTENKQNREIITSERWNELWNLSITQGDNSQAVLQQVITELLAAQTELDKTVESTNIRHIRLNSDKVIETSADGLTWESTGSSGHIILDNAGNHLPQRSRLRFANTVVTDDGTNTVISGVTGPQGPQGLKGDTGAVGPTGPRGLIGQAIVPSVDANGIMSFTIQDTAEAPTPRNVRGPQGPAGMQGPQGVQGPQGPQGVQGPMGPQGNQGLPGIDGRSFVIQDVFPTLATLKAAFPVGNEYAYQVTGSNREIFIWSEASNDWISLGAIQGPTGPQGIQGAQGPQGVQGVQGPAGADGRSAFQSAVEAGYTGDELTFNTSLMEMPEHLIDTTVHHELANDLLQTTVGKALDATQGKALNDAMFKKDGSVQMTGVLKTVGGSGLIEQLDFITGKIYYDGTNKLCYITANLYFDGTKWRYISNGIGSILGIGGSGASDVAKTYYAASGVKDAEATLTSSNLLTPTTGLPLTGGTMTGTVNLYTGSTVTGNLIYHKGNITHGTAAPSGGSDGDIYLKHS